MIKITPSFNSRTGTQKHSAKVKKNENDILLLKSKMGVFGQSSVGQATR
jgi:hypothetical protein